MAQPDRALFAPGVRRQIIEVRWRFDLHRLGKVVVLTHVDRELGAAFAYSDEPVTYKTNRKGRKVIDHDPKCIQSVYLLDELKPLPHGSLV
jgi:hypothetical protein